MVSKTRYRKRQSLELFRQVKKIIGIAYKDLKDSTIKPMNIFKT